ncbi:MAG: hypothetical protein ACJ75F_06740 [Flavisolibacter sp.]
MRKELASSRNKRESFTATFIRFGSKQHHRGTTATTLLFQGVKNAAGITVADHLWFTMTKGFEQCGLHPGDHIAFEARVTSYSKGYKGLPKEIRKTSQDYKLSHPTKITKLNFT